MPIATFKPDANKKPAPELPKSQPAAYKSVVVDDNQLALNTLTAYVEGAPWTVDYYGQVLSQHNDLRDLDPGSVSIYQQYTRINKLEIRVTSPLTSSQETGSTLVTVTGAAVVHAFMTPNVGDLFIADAGSNHDGIFRITNTERKTFDRDSLYSIEYTLTAYADSQPDLLKELNSKVIREYFFDKDRLVDGLNPVLQPEQFQQAQSLDRSYKTLCEFYFKTFFNREFSTLIIPGQDFSVYDCFLVKFLLKIVSVQDAFEVRMVKDLATEMDPYLEQSQFWSLMYERNYELLTHCNREMGLVTTKAFAIDPTLSGLRYTRIDYIIYPRHGDATVFSGIHKPNVKVESISTLKYTPSQTGTISGMIGNKYIEQNKTIPIIHDVQSDNGYVLSMNFYENKGDISLLELLVIDYLKGNAINQEKLLKVINTHGNWSRLNQFYYIPILLVLIKAVNKGLY